jgi:SAM-dependent methyltransferase
MSLRERGLQRRAERALDRQLDYQRQKSAKLKGREQGIVASMIKDSAAVRRKLEKVRPIQKDARVLEVGSGAHGLIFYFGGKDRIGVDPLADHYSELFPAWQDQARTIAAAGERLPFTDSSFDVVLCDNVVDHAENPRRILEEITRVMAPGAMLYFEVNVHHPFYHVAATTHAGWRALGIPFEITPFADHTVHLTRDAARALFNGLPLRILEEADDIEKVKREAPAVRHVGDRLKRLFFKNAQYEVIALREGGSSA